MVFEGLSEDSAQLKLFMANLTVREYTSGQKFRYYREVKKLLERMVESGEYSGSLKKGIATILNVTERQVRKYSQLEKLPENIQQDVIDEKISLNKAIEMISDKPKKAEPVPLSENISSAIYSDSKEKAEPVPLSQNTSSVVYSESTEKAESVPLSENTSSTIYSDSMEKSEPVPLSTISKSKRLQDDSVIFYKNDCYAPNKIQVLEEHEQYTVFKVFAVKRYKDS